MLVEIGDHKVLIATHVGRGLIMALIPLTQELLGDMTGLTAVHTNRVMRKLREEGVLEPQRQRLDILDLEKLVAIGELRRRDVE